MSDWFFTSDLHGQGALYEQLVGLVASRRPRAVLIGGDLAPHAPGPEGVTRQRVFLQGVLVETARRLREASPDTRLVLLMGNDDWASNLDCLEAHHGDLWDHAHDRVVTIEETAELRLAQPHVVRLEARPPNAEGVGEVQARAASATSGSAI